MHKAECHPTQCDVINDVNSFPTICRMTYSGNFLHYPIRRHVTNRRVAEIQIFEKTYLIVIKDETGLRFKINDSTLFLIWSYA